MTEKYLKYPLRINTNLFYAEITQKEGKFIISLFFKECKDICIKQKTVDTLHLSILTANDELTCLKDLNAFVPKKEN